YRWLHPGGHGREPGLRACAPRASAGGPRRHDRGALPPGRRVRPLGVGGRLAGDPVPSIVVLRDARARARPRGSRHRDGGRGARRASGGGRHGGGRRRGPSARLPLGEPRGPAVIDRIATKGRTVLYVSILISVLLAATAQILLKHGMTQVTNHGAVPLALGQPATTIRRVAANGSVWLGLLTFVVSAAVWIVVLSKVSLSFAYPFVS